MPRITKDDIARLNDRAARHGLTVDAPKLLFLDSTGRAVASALTWRELEAFVIALDYATDVAIKAYRAGGAAQRSGNYADRCDAFEAYSNNSTLALDAFRHGWLVASEA